MSNFAFVMGFLHSSNVRAYLGMASSSHGPTSRNDFRIDTMTRISFNGGYLENIVLFYVCIGEMVQILEIIFVMFDSIRAFNLACICGNLPQASIYIIITRIILFLICLLQLSLQIQSFSLTPKLWESQKAWSQSHCFFCLLLISLLVYYKPFPSASMWK